MLKLYSNGSNSSMASGHLLALVSLLGLPEFQNVAVFFDEEARKEMMQERGLSSIVVGKNGDDKPIYRLEKEGWYIQFVEQTEKTYLVSKVYSKGYRKTEILYTHPESPAQVLRLVAEV